MSKRKLWSATYPMGPARRFESKAAVYRWVQNEVANWLCGALRSPLIRVDVDERDGRGWQTYERLDLRDLAEREVRR